MKQCPTCRTSYTDDSLIYCLSDGTSLQSAADEEPTVVRRAAANPLKIDLASKTEPAADVKAAPASSSTSSTLVKFLIAAIILGALAIAGLGLAGAAFYYGTSGKEPEPPKTPSPTPLAASTPDDEKERLKKEIANIQKKLEEQEKNSDTPANNNDDELGSSITATVDSPNDGFLALRSQPDADRGERIAKIPHGAEVEIQNCEKNAVTIGGRTGRWCQVDYDGLTGWVFDAWLEY